MSQTTRDKILELAQEAIATRGYSAFSFRELAADLGIKSASVHYHFATKSELGVAVARGYRQRLASALDRIAKDNTDAYAALNELVALYRREVRSSQRMTVCTLLAAEIKNLPDDIVLELKEFYELNLGWIAARLEQLGLDAAAREEKARQLFALLQGGLIGAKSQNDPDYFDLVVKAMQPLILAK